MGSCCLVYSCCLIFRVVWNPKRDKSVVTTLIYCTAYLDHTTVENSSGTTKTQVAESSDSQVAQTSFLGAFALQGNNI